MDERGGAGRPSAEDVAEEPRPPATTAELERLEGERDQYLDALQRLKAEFDNFRKRNDRDRQTIALGATREVVRDLLPVMDNLERAVAALGDQGEQIVAGLEMVRGQLAALLTGHGVEEIPATASAFDPTVHEAIASVPSPRPRRGHGHRGGREGLPPLRARPAAHPRRDRGRPAAGGVAGERVREEGRDRVDDLYATLGVAKTASADEIKKAYRKLARVHHPDANPDDPKAEERFKEISHAHDVLSDPEKRARVRRARCRSAAGARNGGRPRRRRRRAAASATSPTCSRPSSAARAAGARAAAGGPVAQKGADVEVEVNLSFDQAMAGAQVPVSVETPVACADCGGSGAKPGTNPRLCPECKGRGVRGRDVGSFAFSEPCPRCGGNGTVIDDPCPTCSGSGTTSTRSQIKVKIPPGVKDGTRIRVKGRGQAGTRGGPAGDLYVVTRVSPSRLFTRKGDDLVINVPVTFAEAALGAQVEVPTLDGRVKLTVPPGSAGRPLAAHRRAGRAAPQGRRPRRPDRDAAPRRAARAVGQAARRAREVRQDRRPRSAGDAVLMSTRRTRRASS